MKISELILFLRDAQDKHGDVQVKITHSGLLPGAIDTEEFAFENGALVLDLDRWLSDGFPDQRNTK